MSELFVAFRAMNKGRQVMGERTRLQKAGEFSIFLSACLAGILSVPAIMSVIGLSVLLLVVSDRGQHRALMDRFQSLPKDWILTLSFGSHIALNVVALAAAYGVGWLLNRGFQFVV
jgi:hypothetical protein